MSLIVFKDVHTEYEFGHLNKFYGVNCLKSNSILTPWLHIEHRKLFFLWKLEGKAVAQNWNLGAQWGTNTTSSYVKLGKKIYLVNYYIAVFFHFSVVLLWDPFRALKCLFWRYYEEDFI